eukprot:Hpha_TRINITY_DN14584_c0_g1::TRINITY_DN14584_c0_g1_i3::g.46978::m.46978
MPTFSGDDITLLSTIPVVSVWADDWPEVLWKFAKKPSSQLKTRLCRAWVLGRCTHGNNCNFSHGLEDDYSPHRHGQRGKVVDLPPETLSMLVELHYDIELVNTVARLLPEHEDFLEQKYPEIKQHIHDLKTSASGESAEWVMYT